ncbi:putative virion structural protein [Bacillus phage vB_BspM_AgentSmith]|nr:putative virion structural protein [Bacillus phage vB_BspM_AgentSmith]
MFIVSSLGYWVSLIVYVTLLSTLITTYPKKRNRHIDSRIEESFFIRTDLMGKMTYYDFKNTVYVFLFVIALIPVINLIGIGYLLWMLFTED